MTKKYRKRKKTRVTDYEKLTLKLKMVELAQKQTMLSFKANQIGTPQAAKTVVELDDLLDSAVIYVTEALHDE